MGKAKQVVVFGGGCFWCTEAVFKQLRGVVSVVSGFAGGKTANPNYEDVAYRGNTGHAEVVKAEFDPAVIKFKDLLNVFFTSHDPTTPNRQGNDTGDQYRSVIFYTSEKQCKEAAAYVKELERAKAFERPIVTELVPLDKFYPAEQGQQDYYQRNKLQPYCMLVISPKLAKLRKQHQDLLKKKN
ncbi:MAG: peptide-methionine (S)-S-oxide reductase MsrA [Candidatus Aenigmarchaeota archaeon]|nr:peptide-methionine (S)-S-oxide reductase MsrA [Candidatus Aenigmarchaeota archaeon]